MDDSIDEQLFISFPFDFDLLDDEIPQNNNHHNFSPPPHHTLWNPQILEDEFSFPSILEDIDNEVFALASSSSSEGKTLLDNHQVFNALSSDDNNPQTIGAGNGHLNQLPGSCLYQNTDPLRSQDLDTEEQLLNQLLKNMIEGPKCSPNNQVDRIPLASMSPNSLLLSLPLLRPQPYQVNEALFPTNLQNSQGRSKYTLRHPNQQQHYQLNNSAVKPFSPNTKRGTQEELQNVPNQQIMSNLVLPSLFDSQIDLHSQPSMFQIQRSQILEEQELLNKITGPCLPYPSSLGGSRWTQFLNSTELIKHDSSSSFSELKMSLKIDKKKNFRRPRRKNRCEAKEPSPVSKRLKRDLVSQGDQILETTEGGKQNSFNERSVKIYDEIFESVGLPIDPHLRHLLAK